MGELTVQPGDTAWSLCNSHGISLAELYAANKHLDLDHLKPGQKVKVPVVLGLEHYQQQQEQALSSSQSHKQGFLGLPLIGSLLHSSNNSSGRPANTHSSSNSNSVISNSSRGDARGAAGVSSSTYSEAADSSSDNWLEAGSSFQAGGGLLGRGGHLLQLITQSSSSTGSGSSSGSSASHTSSNGFSLTQFGLPNVHSPAAAAVAHAAASGNVPDGGLVAVKIQYPGALQTMTLDLVNLRATSAFLQKTELKFDLLSAVEELQRQIHLEFDFMR